MNAFTAKYAGICNDCGGPIVPGEMVQYNDENKVAHNGCASRERDGVTCPKCFMQKPCECDDPDLAKA